MNFRPAETSQALDAVVAVLSRRARPIDAGEMVLVATLAIDELAMDSLDQLEVAMEIEDLLEIELPEADLKQCRTVGDLVSLCDRCLERRRAAS